MRQIATEKLTVRRAIPALIWILFMVVPCGAAQTCVEVGSRFQNEQLQLDELLISRDELNKKFQSDVAADFAAQSEGILDEIHRNAAIKIVYAKKRIARRIKEKESELAALREHLCVICESSKSITGDKLPVLCKHCPLLASCRFP